jgi:uncharacterized protein YcbK (DUF882 family)
MGLSNLDMNEHTLKNRVIDDDGFIESRRRFLKNMAYGSLLTIAGTSSVSAAVKHFPSHKAIALQNIHTGDKLKLTYFERGRYIEDALDEISYVFRDYHNDSVHPIDPDLLDQLYDLRLSLGINKNKPFHIVSGYRSPVTNARMRKKHAGVAKHSLHMQGRAIDIQIDGVDTRVIRNAAIAMRRGGVGYYARSGFVHLDTGRFRTW